jgi:serine/threonine protein kinase
MHGIVIRDKYQVGQLIGEGGMARVYLAKENKTGNYFAVKIIKPELAGKDRSFREKFIREAMCSINLKHRNILRVYDAGAQAGLHYLLMDYIRGKNLREIITRNGPLPLSFIAHVVKQIGDAISHVHSNKFIHGDIKSSNIMVGDANCEAVLMDFGIAKPVDEKGKVLPEVQSGTPEYMSPEQANGCDASICSDIYSFGIVIYEMLTGRVPFKSDTPQSTLKKHLTDPVPPILSVRRDITPEVESVINKALARQTADRYQSINAFVNDLLRCLSPLAGNTLVRPTTAGVKTQKNSRKFVLVCLLMIIVLLFVLTTVIIGYSGISPRGGGGGGGGFYNSNQTFTGNSGSNSVIRSASGYNLPGGNTSQVNTANAMSQDEQESLCLLADTYIQELRFDEAISAFTRVINANPANASAYFGRGYVYLLLQKLPEAESDLTYALKYEPGSTDILLVRASACLLQNKLNQCISDTSLIIQNQPSYAIAYFLRARAYLLNGNYKSACTDLEMTVTLDPTLILASETLDSLKADGLCN